MKLKRKKYWNEPAVTLRKFARIIQNKYIENNVLKSVEIVEALIM